MQVRLRNYVPLDAELCVDRLGGAVPLDLVGRARAVAERAMEGADEAAAVRRPDWDLKRDLQDKLDVLEAATQQALAKLAQAQHK
jgi:hypothetical protein